MPTSVPIRSDSSSSPEPPVGCDQPARPDTAHLVVSGLFVRDEGLVQLHRGVRDLRGQELVERVVIARFLPFLRRRVALVQEIVDTAVEQGVLLRQLIVIVDAVQACGLFGGAIRTTHGHHDGTDRARLPPFARTSLKYRTSAGQAASLAGWGDSTRARQRGFTSRVPCRSRTPGGCRPAVRRWRAHSPPRMQPGQRWAVPAGESRAEIGNRPAGPRGITGQRDDQLFDDVGGR